MNRPDRAPNRALLLTALLVALLAAAAPAPAAQDARALVTQAMEAYGRKDFRASLEHFRRAIAAGASSSETFYNAACSAALAGDPAAAFAYLDQAVDHGWREANHMKNDADLAALHGDPRWAAAVAKAEKAEKAYLTSINAELYALHNADQADRSGDIAGVDWDVVSKRDAERRKRVREILDAGGAKVADDYFHAAMVFQHGDTPDDYQLAHTLAAKAAELNPKHPVAKWLAAAAKDRYLMSVGKPQIYGTQFRRLNGGAWSIDPIDEAAVTDAERQAMGVPTLAETRKRLAAMNAELEKK